MIRYLSFRLLLALPALWLILTMVFMLAHIVPGDPVAQMLGEGARADDLQQLRHTLGLDLPLPVQYGRYLAGIAHGNLGESFRFQQPVLQVVISHYPATLELAFVALLVCTGIGIPAGLFAAARNVNGLRHRRFHFIWALPAEFRSRARLDSRLLRTPRLASGFRTRRSRASDSPGVYSRRSTRGYSHAHGAHLCDRRTFQRLRSHRASKRSV